MRAVPDVSLSAASHDGYFVEESGSMWIMSGTSAGAPSFAGVMALVVKKQDAWQGNANAELYKLVNGSRNPFHTTQSGNNSVSGVAGFTASGTAYNLATGLGSVDGALLVNEWGAESTSPTLSLKAAANSVTVEQGDRRRLGSQWRRAGRSQGT